MMVIMNPRVVRYMLRGRSEGARSKNRSWRSYFGYFGWVFEGKIEVKPSKNHDFRLKNTQNLIPPAEGVDEAKTISRTV